jgi:hypothetical protein
VAAFFAIVLWVSGRSPELTATGAQRPSGKNLVGWNEVIYNWHPVLSSNLNLSCRLVGHWWGIGGALVGHFWDIWRVLD